MRQREDGACIFLLADGRCQVHGEFGFEAKPIACQLFPYMLAPTESTSQMGVSFACQSVVENRGKLLCDQTADALRIALRGVSEVVRPARAAPLARGRAAEPNEVESLTRHLVGWIARDAPLSERLDGLAWMSQTLASARLGGVRGTRFIELLDLLFGSLAGELPHHPLATATPRQVSLFQNAIFARTEDPKPIAHGAPGRVVSTISQLRRSRAWRRGRDAMSVPSIGVGWPIAVTFDGVAHVDRIRASTERVECDELLSRWLRTSIEGGRVWGSSYYGWSVIDGLCALTLSAAAVGWLARFHAAGSSRERPGLVDVQAAVGRIDRSAGRAVWLGGWSERMRMAYLIEQNGLRRIVAAQY